MASPAVLLTRDEESGVRERRGPEHHDLGEQKGTNRSRHVRALRAPEFIG
jgi:hypothetical protein